MLDFEKIGERIYQQRKQVNNMSQEQFAEAMGWYQSDVSNLEKAKSGSGITDLYKLCLIADYFQIPLEHLLFGEGDGKMMKQSEIGKESETPEAVVDTSPEALMKISKEIESARKSIKGDLYRAGLLKTDLEQGMHLLLQGDATPFELEILADKLDYFKKAGAFLDKDVRKIRAELRAMRDQFTDDAPDNFLRIYNKFEYDVMEHVTELDDIKLLIRNYEALLQEMLEKRGA